MTVPNVSSFNSLPPVGLMGLFQIKSDGRTPRPWDTLQFTFDTGQFFARATEQVQFGAVSAAAAVGIAAAPYFTVPANKGWLLTGCSLSVVTTALQYYRGKVFSQFTSLLQAELLPELVSDLQGALAVNDARVATPGWNPILLAPSTNIVGYHEKLTAGPINVFCSVRYVEFPWS